jgi:lysylphosphatidylglycerol synthetase-like protein (DUF2156 family)
MEMEKIARWAFVAVIVIAILMGLVVGSMADVASAHTLDTNVVDATAYVVLVMLILGIIVGFSSVVSKEVTAFLIAAIALVVVGTSTVWSAFMLKSQLNLLYYWATDIVAFIAAFAAPAAVIIAVRSLLAIEKEKT